ncbi:hypothetical protein TREMEDRAFT_61538 [Tremella mesenterica DSM 1558]|uniref:uncharacterized protein n=1 Tax=Tremella mesenterica (strain ATCC 24925 / CBS 8224 / DSM 1558 / NBRC 9311 / NRRL Y-6157 / RJB 2259-6 / UBC 559-6) TaxID=578456 RepID=UPI0003F490A6|nr:uncharacterized protein TREMEDRAFT_61538 [Tremella mesenterica DSM 1558]EIW69771.1 hypothetical protein TREMEDRAFT_61538 [Tremella mesenterica DSM 1558]
MSCGVALSGGDLRCVRISHPVQTQPTMVGTWMSGGPQLRIIIGKMAIMDPSTSKISLAYLGPEGTYGHQAAQVFLPALSEDVDLELIPCPTISDVYHHPSDYLVLPVQNTLAGSVTETVDCLLSPLSSGRKTGEVELGGMNGGEAGPSRPRIIGSTDLEIAHCLVVRRGVNMDDIKWVRSHEQALTQSTIFLHTHLPFATLHPWRSTASAALSLLQLSPEDPPGDGAALCSKAVLTLYPQLELLYEGTQAGNGMSAHVYFLMVHS